MENSEFSLESVMAEASRMLDQYANIKRQNEAKRMAHLVGQKIGEEQFDPASPYSRFQRIMIIPSSQSVMPFCDIEDAQAFIDGASRYAELHFMRQRMIQLEEAMQRNGLQAPPISLEPKPESVINPLWSPPSSDIVRGMELGMRNGISKIMGMLCADVPGFNEEDWVEAEKEAEYIDGKWVYRGATCLEGVNVVCEYAPESVDPQLFIAVSPV